MPDFRPRNYQHAICGNCGKVVRISTPNFRLREIKLWWTTPLAAVIWLAIIWKFDYALNSPNIEAEPSPPIVASFMELPEEIPHIPGRNPELQSKAVPKPTEMSPPPDMSSRADIAESKPAAPPSAPTETIPPQTDLLAYVTAARVRSSAAEMAASEANANAREPSADEIRTANIMRNLQPPSTNGIFQIIHISSRKGKFSFRGWTHDASNSRRELIEVDAGPDGDVERAMVRSMIGLIRKYYKGDFNWESHRLDRVIILSARIEDNEGLEEFLMREFFGAGNRLKGASSQYLHPRMANADA